MRTIALAFLILAWPSFAAADVILPGAPPRPWRPRPGAERPVSVPRPAPPEPEDEPMHPNLEEDPAPAPHPEEAAMALLAMMAFAGILAVRDARRERALG